MQRGGYEFVSHTCLLPQITERTSYLLHLYKRTFSKGNYLVDGGYFNQPNVFLTAMELIDG